MIKIATIAGARPQFVKASVLSRSFSRYSDMEEVLIHTGQHYDPEMSDVFFREMQIPEPRYCLDINRESVHRSGTEAGPAFLTGKMMQEIERVLRVEKPHWVLVYGDTDSTLAGALTAAKLHIPLIHVEAGLRSHNMDMPEELNRILTDRMSRLLFCPTDTAMQNLREEGYGNFPVRFFRSGDIMQDAALYYARKSKSLHNITIPDSFILCTLHRNENISDPTVLQHLAEALDRIAVRMPVVFPLHPGTRRRMEENGYDFTHTPVHFIDPVGYLEMVFLLQHCRFVMTDSGGLQKEAYFFRKMCLTLREETEWTELVENKCNILLGSDPEKITGTAAYYWENPSGTFVENLYGNGNAGGEIVRIIRENSRFASGQQTDGKSINGFSE